MSAMEWPRPVRQALTVLIVATFVILIVFGIQLFMSKRGENFREGADMKPLPCSPQHTIQSFGSDVLYSDAASIVGQPMDPKKLPWVIEFSEPETKYRAENGKIVTWSGQTINIYDDHGASLNSLSFFQPVEDVRIGLNLVAVHLGGPAEYIQVIDALTTAPIDMQPLTSTLLDFGFFSPDDQLWCSTLDSSGASTNSAVMITAPKRASYSTIPVDNGLLIYKVVFNMELSQLTLISTHQMDYYNQKWQLLPSDYQRQVYGWQLIDARATKETTYTIFTPVNQLSQGTDSTISTLQLYYGTNESQLRLPMPCKRVIAGANGIYAISDNYVYRYAYPDPRGKVNTVPTAIKTRIPIETVYAILADDSLIVSAEGTVYQLPM